MKNTNSKLILSVFLSFTVLFFANGQQEAIKERADRLIETDDLMTVKGTVTAFNKYCVKNVEVTARKTKSKALTDSLGRFEIMAPMGDVLIFNAMGFEKNKRKVTAYEDKINVNMILMPGERNKKIAVLYGYMNERDITYAVEHYSNRNNDFLKYSNMSELLRAELVGTRVTDQGGIQVFTRSGDISSIGTSENSIGMSENDGAASFILDGMIVSSIDFLNPWDVKSVTLVKDAGGAGIYGSRGANGVVLINTK